MAQEKPWDLAGFAAESVWAEMDAFLAECEAAGTSKTKEETDARSARFLEIQERCNRRALEAFMRATAGSIGSKHGA